MQQIIEVINIFCSSKSKTHEVKEADEYLKKLERSKESWSLSIQILEQDNLDKDTYFIAAKILKSKLEFDFGQLSTEEAQALPHKLMQVLRKHQESSRSVQGQLIDAFIFCYLHMYEKWPDLLEFIKSNFYINPQMQNYIFLIFEYLPDNVFSKSLVMDDKHRSGMVEFFKNNIQARILGELDVIARSSNIDQKIQYRLLKIMSNWIDFKTNADVLNVLQNHAVFDLALNSMGEVELQEYSALTIIAVLRQLKSEEQQVKHKEMFQKIAKHVFAYFGACKAAHVEGDFEAVKFYSRIFMKFGNRALSQFMDPNNLDAASQQFLMNMLDVTCYEEIENEEEMSDFWRCFLGAIAEKSDQDRTLLIARYTVLIAELLKMCVKKITFSQECFALHQELSPKEIESMNVEYEEKNSQRFHMRDIAISVSELIGAEEVIMFCAAQMSSLGCLVGSADCDIAEDKARELEGILYCLNHVVFVAQRADEKISPSEEQEDAYCLEEQSKKGRKCLVFSNKSEEYIFDILKAVLSRKCGWVRLNRTLFSLMLSSSDFLQKNMAVCQLSFNMIVAYLQTPLLQEIAQSAFEVLCKDCPLFVQQNIDTFLKNVYSSMMFNHQIVAGIAHAICASDEYLNLHFINLCKPYATDLINYINLPQAQQNDPGTIQSLKKPLKVLKNIMISVPEREQRGAFPHQLLQEIFKQIWPVLKFIIETQAQQTSLIENIVSVLKQFIKKMSYDFDIFFIDFLQQIVSLYKTSCQPGILYIVEKCVKTFSNSHEGYAPYLQSAFEVLVETTLRILPTPDSFIENPDVVEDFFGFLGRFLKYFPVIFFSSQHVMQILGSVSIGIKLEHREASKALFAFLELIYLVLGPSYAEKLQTVRPQVEQLKNLLLTQLSYQYNVLLFEALADVPQREIREFIFDVFIAQIHIFGPNSVNFFQPIFFKLKEDICTKNEKEMFLTLLLSNTSNPIDDKFEEQLVDFFVLIGDRFKKSYRRAC